MLWGSRMIVCSWAHVLHSCCRATWTSSNPEFAPICEKLHVLLLQTITCSIINFSQLSRLLFLWVKALISPLRRISKWYVIGAVWYVLATAFEAPCLAGCCGVVHVAVLFKDWPHFRCAKRSCPATSVLGKCVLFSMLIFFVLLCHLRHSHREDHKVCDIVHRPTKQIFWYKNTMPSMVVLFIYCVWPCLLVVRNM